jgi:hypothetical protein
MRSGTTTLWHHLARHPEIFMSPIKEPRYFAVRGMTSDKLEIVKSHPLWQGTVLQEKVYRDLFREAKQEPIVGEASPLYLVYPTAAAEIAKAVPHAKILISLRHPVDRAVSHFEHNRREGFEKRQSFYEAFHEDYRTSYAGYFRLGQYHAQLRPYFDLFSREQIKVVFFEDLLTGPAAWFRSILEFLDVTPHTLQPPDVIEKAGKKGMDRHLKSCLNICYLEDIFRLEELLETDLSPWTDESRTSKADEDDFLLSPWFYLNEE